MIQERSSVGTPRSALIDGSAMFMIDASSTTTNCATARRARASQRRGSSTGAGETPAGAAWTDIEVAFRYGGEQGIRAIRTTSRQSQLQKRTLRTARTATALMTMLGRMRAR